MFSGCMTALVTPMQTNGAIDFVSLAKLVERQLVSGINGLVINGTTGEAPTVTKTEQLQILQAVIKQVKGQVPVIAGTGNYATKQTIDHSLQALDAGANACLIITPYYNKPTQAGLYDHYAAIAQAVIAPIILYNAPGRTGCDLLPETVAKLAQLPSIIGLKECLFTLPRLEQLLRINDFILLSGNDDETLTAMRLGFKGVISVASNIVPKTMQQLCQAAAQQDFKTAAEIYQQLLPLMQALFYESNPIPCKWLLHQMGLISDKIRLPLTPLSEKYRTAVCAALDNLLELKTSC